MIANHYTHFDKCAITPDLLPVKVKAPANGEAHINGHSLINGNMHHDAQTTNGDRHANGESHANGLTPAADKSSSNGIRKALTNGSSRCNGEVNDINGNSLTPRQTVQSKILVFSAADEKSVNRMVQDYTRFYKDTFVDDAPRLDKLSFTLAARRSHMLWRAFTITMNSSDSEGKDDLTLAKPLRSSTETGLAFVFTGQGAQYVDMGWDLIQFPVFADTLRQINNLYGELGCSWSLFGACNSAECLEYR